MTNIDRTPRNANMMVWHRKLWLIDHGAALYFHHAWDGALARSRSPFAQIKRSRAVADGEPAGRSRRRTWRAGSTCGLLRDIVAAIPDAWLGQEPGFADAEAHRAAYLDWLQQRIEAPRAFVEEAIRAHAALV